MTKHKLWGVLYNPLEVGNYSLIAENNYKIDRMRITKSVHITESSKIGGKSFFIPTFLGVFCIGCIVFSILFYRKFKETEKSIDKSKLRWRESLKTYNKLIPMDIIIKLNAQNI